MEPEQRGASHRLSATDGSAAGLNGSVGSRVHKVKDVTSVYLDSFTAFFTISHTNIKLNK